MKTIPRDLHSRLLFILHHGLVEIRNLALGQGNEQIADLADALENLPKYVDDCDAEDYELIHLVLEGYEKKYGARAYEHRAYLEERTPPTGY